MQSLFNFLICKKKFYSLKEASRKEEFNQGG
jgi:hypothetical protein